MGLNRISIVALVLCSGPVWADFDAASYPPYERCALCHGLFGQSHSAKFPHLAGQKPAYIEAQLEAFLSGSRSNDGGQMAAIVTELKPEEFPVVVDWFSTQEPPSPGAPSVDTVGQGLVADLGCFGCHADTSDSAPYLTAQHAGYLEKQMTDFISGARSGGDTAAVHSDLLKPLTSDLGAIASYLSSMERRP
ncbi:cytochrome C [bacterium]|nr:cytochrome C [bacterium]